MRQNVYYNSLKHESRYYPQGLDQSHRSRRFAPLLLSGQYDRTVRELTTLDDTLASSGNVEAPTGWFAILEITSDAYQRTVEMGWLQENGLEQPDLPDGGWYLYTQDNNGLSMVYECEDGDHADELYSLLEERYSEYELGEPTDRELAYLDASKRLQKCVAEDDYTVGREIMSELLELDLIWEEIERAREFIALGFYRR